MAEELHRSVNDTFDAVSDDYDILTQKTTTKTTIDARASAFNQQL